MLLIYPVWLRESFSFARLVFTNNCSIPLSVNDDCSIPFCEDSGTRGTKKRIHDDCRYSSNETYKYSRCPVRLLI